MKSMRKVWILPVILALVCAPLAADPPMTKLRIEVKNLSGKAVERASVVVRFIEGRSVVKLGKKIKTNWELRTNQDGVAAIPPIPQGKITLQVYAKGYQTFGDVIDVNEEEKTVAVVLKPPQSQYSSHQ
jgi:hypothetical protein